MRSSRLNNPVEVGKFVLDRLAAEDRTLTYAAGKLGQTRQSVHNWKKQGISLASLQVVATIIPFSPEEYQACVNGITCDPEKRTVAITTYREDARVTCANARGKIAAADRHFRHGHPAIALLTTEIATSVLQYTVKDPAASRDTLANAYELLVRAIVLRLRIQTDLAGADTLHERTTDDRTELAETIEKLRTYDETLAKPYKYAVLAVKTEHLYLGTNAPRHQFDRTTLMNALAKADDAAEKLREHGRIGESVLIRRCKAVLHARLGEHKESLQDQRKARSLLNDPSWQARGGRSAPYALECGPKCHLYREYDPDQLCRSIEQALNDLTPFRSLPSYGNEAEVSLRHTYLILALQQGRERRPVSDRLFRSAREALDFSLRNGHQEKLQWSRAMLLQVFGKEHPLTAYALRPDRPRAYSGS